jgi:hypothetical protein
MRLKDNTYVTEEKLDEVANGLLPKSNELSLKNQFSMESNYSEAETSDMSYVSASAREGSQKRKVKKKSSKRKRKKMMKQFQVDLELLVYKNEVDELKFLLANHIWNKDELLDSLADMVPTQTRFKMKLAKIVFSFLELPSKLKIYDDA